MKTRFTTLDLIAELSELQDLVGMRVNQIYDVDHKTYLFKMHRTEEKAVLLLESGARIHKTEFEWPKNPAPSGFSMKLRKHIRNKRVESIRQLGVVDRVVDIQFGSESAAYHVLLELYDRGNIVLTDCEYKILNILRPRVQGEEKFLVRETYPVDLTRNNAINLEKFESEVLPKAKPADTLKRIMMPLFDYGPALLEHLLLEHNLTPNTKIREFSGSNELLVNILNEEGKAFLETASKRAVIIQKAESRPSNDGKETEEFLSYQEFHPYLMNQHLTMSSKLIKDFERFDLCIDDFFSKIESQKLDLKAIQQEKQAMKKLENVKKDHSIRISKLKEEQEYDKRKGELIELNQNLVEHALTVIRSAIANQIDWKEINLLIKEATNIGDPVASRIKELKFNTNHFSMLLSDPYEDDNENEEKNELLVDIDIDLSAQANARRYYVQRKSAAKKEQKTIESQSVAMKSAERKTKMALKEVATITNINKARKVYWFEKFFWFISSENYLVIAGRDTQQNELIVKRYMRPEDIYVHADLHGASSVVIKNPSGQPVPPKTLNEAGAMAICYSAAWDSKMVTNAWWVSSSQVSKSAPTGEYLTPGSFMIRGKKNFLPPCHLILGFGFLFKLEESSVPRHKDERKVRNLNEEEEEHHHEKSEDIELKVSSGDEEESESKENDGPTSNEKVVVPENENDEEEKDSNDRIIDSEEDVAKDNEISGDHHAKEEDLDEEMDELNVKEENTDDGDEKIDKKVDELKISSDSEEEEEGQFPDTNVSIGFSLTSGEMKVKIRAPSERSEGVIKDEKLTFTEKTTIRPKDMQNETTTQKQQQQQQQPPKRGKRGKMKKLKEKYKDQDEEEKELRMKLLQGRTKEGTSKKRDKKAAAINKEANKKAAQIRFKEQQLQKQLKQQQQQLKKGNNEEDIEDEEEKTIVVSAEVDMLDSLTGIPVGEDELLFGVPVVAPYSVMTNYKFKVKVTPGTGKRGKATKTALNMFLQDKTASPREKDLLKSVKDQDLARNLPGKVKLSAPHLQKVKQNSKKK